MERVLKVTVLAVLLSLAAASNPYDYNAGVLKHLHRYDYSATYKLEAINTDSLQNLTYYKDKQMAGTIRMEEKNEPSDADGNCSGHLGVRLPGSSENNCLKAIEVVMYENIWPKTASLELIFEDSDGLLLELDVPLFKETTALKEREKYDSKVLRAEPLTSDQVRSLRQRSKNIEFSAPWLKALLEKPLNGVEDFRIKETYVTYPIVMPDDKFKDLLECVRDSERPIWS